MPDKDMNPTLTLVVGRQRNNMELEDAIKYLVHRIQKLNTTYKDSWPRWTNIDFVAVSLVLQSAQHNMQPTAARDGASEKPADDRARGD